MHPGCGHGSKRDSVGSDATGAGASYGPPPSEPGGSIGDGSDGVSGEFPHTLLLLPDIERDVLNSYGPGDELNDDAEERRSGVGGIVVGPKVCPFGLKSGEISDCPAAWDIK